MIALPLALDHRPKSRAPVCCQRPARDRPPRRRCGMAVSRAMADGTLLTAVTPRHRALSGGSPREFPMAGETIDRDRPASGFVRSSRARRDPRVATGEAGRRPEPHPRPRPGRHGYPWGRHRTPGSPRTGAGEWLSTLRPGTPQLASLGANAMGSYPSHFTPQGAN
jgi:hypothetical protein